LNRHRYDQKKPDFWHYYFTGGWFEYWVWQQLTDNGEYDDVRCNVKVHTNFNGNAHRDARLRVSTIPRHEIKNEIDVLAIRNGVPVFIECKAGKITAATVNNLYSMAERYGGRYAQKLLISLYPERSPSIRDKINESGIDWIYGPEAIIYELKKYHENLVVRV